MQNLASTQTQSWLAWFLKGVLLLGMAVLLARLFELQIIKGNYFHALAEDNRIRRVPIVAPRGQIYARNGEVLVGNKEIKKWVTFNPQSGFEKKDIEAKTPTDEVISEWTRDYLLGKDLAHVSGYLGQVNEDEVGKVSPECAQKGPRRLGTWIGRGGLEQQYECTVRGIDGEEMVEVDTYGKKIRTIGRQQPLAGQDIHTTIDFDLQRKVALAMNNQPHKGAVVVSNGKGEILAFYSNPSFDPTNIAPSITDSNLPMFNRVISGAYHPGSVFKMITGLAALQEGKITKDYTFTDEGVIRINEFSYANWYFTQYGGKEGAVNLERALARSTDTYFYKIGELLGADLLAAWAQKFGVGEPTGIDLPGEIAGLVPTPAWKEEYKGEKWFLGNTYHMAIGQGDTTTTPLEVNTYTSAIAQKGLMCKPYLNKDVASQQCQQLDIKQEYFDEVKKGMIAACASGGTAFPFFDFKPHVACKTGTAETEEKDKTHAWFTVYAPAENPEVVVTVLLEKAGEGSREAAPIARSILDYWFHSDTF